MENVHILDNETVESLISMFNSENNDNIRMALAILNNADCTDVDIVKFVNELNNECTGLHFALFQNKKGEIRARFAYIFYHLNRPFMIDDESSFNDNEEWIPYEPHADLD